MVKSGVEVSATRYIGMGGSVATGRGVVPFRIGAAVTFPGLAVTFEETIPGKAVAIADVAVVGTGTCAGIGVTTPGTPVF